MKKHATITILGVAVASGFLSGCLNTVIWGFPLGPSTDNGLALRKVVFPTRSGTSCQFNPSGQGQLMGAVELSDASPSQYIMVVAAENTNVRNENQLQIQPQGPHQGTYGSVNSNDIDIVSAHVRYEYPTLTAAKFLYQQLPQDGYIFQSQTIATGSVRVGETIAAPITALDQALANTLREDSEFQEQLRVNGQVPIVMRVQVEGRTQSGHRVTSNELRFQVNAVPGLTCAGLSALPPEQGGCNPRASNGNTGTRLVAVPAAAAPCFPGQDNPSCFCEDCGAGGGPCCPGANACADGAACVGGNCP